MKIRAQDASSSQRAYKTLLEVLGVTKAVGSIPPEVVSLSSSCIRRRRVPELQAFGYARRRQSSTTARRIQWQTTFSKIVAFRSMYLKRSTLLAKITPPRQSLNTPQPSFRPPTSLSLPPPPFGNGAEAMVSPPCCFQARPSVTQERLSSKWKALTSRIRRRTRYLRDVAAARVVQRLGWAVGTCGEIAERTMMGT